MPQLKHLNGSSQTIHSAVSDYFGFQNYVLGEDEKGVPLYWHWDDHGRTAKICASLGAGGFTKLRQGALARIVMHAHFEALGASRPIHYSRSKSAKHWNFPHIKKRPFYSYGLIIPAVDFLETHGLIHSQKGLSGTFGRQSEFRATYRLIANLASQPFRMLAPDNPLILRNAENDELEIPNNRKSERMAKRVDAQNQLILGTKFTASPELRSPVRRIFRHDMQHLGRFYAVGASWQTVNNNTRKLIQIEGQQTTYLDYSGCNVNIAYRLIGKNPPDNPYRCDNFSRSDSKLALMILLNAKDKAEAIRALAHHSDFTGKGSNDLLVLRYDADFLISELELRHMPLGEAKMFFGSGLSLMRTESDIADKVMSELRGLGIVALPIHDGFMVKIEHKAKLLESMIENSRINSGPPIPVSEVF